MNLLLDPSFSLGLNVLNQSNGNQIDGQLRVQAGTTPVWSLAQFWSKSNIMLENGNMSGHWTDENKGVSLCPGGINLKVNGFSEYGGKQCNITERPWPHLIVGQRVSAPLANYTKMTFSGRFCMIAAAKKSAAGFNDSTIYHVILTIQNLNKSSAHYGDLFNLVIPIYDSRLDVVPALVSFDKTTTPGKPGSGNAMYRIQGLGSLPVTRKVDVILCAKQGLQAVQAAGAMIGSTFADLSVGSVFIGFEVSNIDVTCIRAQNLALFADPIATGNQRIKMLADQIARGNITVNDIDDQVS